MTPKQISWLPPGGLRWPTAGNVLAAVSFLVVIELEIWIFENDTLSLGQQLSASAVAPFVAVPLAYRTRDAMASFAVNSVATIVLVTIGYGSDVYQWANLVLLFTVSAAHRGVRSWSALVAGLLGVVYYFSSLQPNDWDIFLAVLGLWVIGWMIGRAYGSRLEEDRLRAERDLAAEVAATRQERLELEAQRSLMARELHDLIGHTVNVMVVHAGAGRRAVRVDPDGAEQAFATIETTGRSALEELDRVLGILRHDNPDVPVAPPPGLDDVADLVEDVNRAGLQARLTTVGPVDAVPVGVGLTIYRIVQEALTNTLKHADAARAEIDINVTGRTVEVVVTDDVRGSKHGFVEAGDLGSADLDGAGGPAPSVATVTGGPGSNQGSKTVAEIAFSPPVLGMTAGLRSRGPEPDSGRSVGRGLTGIAERVRLHGGEVEFGPVEEPRAGFRVRCVLALTHANAEDRQ